jgi:hypothetical protein
MAEVPTVVADATRRALVTIASVRPTTGEKQMGVSGLVAHFSATSTLPASRYALDDAKHALHPS